MACAVETGGLPAAARRWKGVKAPKGNSCAAAILLPPRFLARRSRRHHRAFSISPSSSLAETSTSHGRRRAPRGRRVVVGGEGRLSRPGQCCLSPPFSPGGTEKRRFPPAPPSRPPSPPPPPPAVGIGFFSFPRQERVNKTLLLLASMAAKSLLTLRGRPKRFPF